MSGSADLLAVLCDIAEAGDGPFPHRDLRGRFGAIIDGLITLGALAPGAPLKSVVCGACDNDHFAKVEFDAGRRRRFHFCPEAGRIDLTDADLATLRFDVPWLIERVAASLPLQPKRRRELIAGCAWDLGVTTIGDRPATIVLARRSGAAIELDSLAAALQSLPPAGIGVVLITGQNPPRSLDLPHGHRFVELREILTFGGAEVRIDGAKLAAALEAGGRRQRRPGATRGRPTQAADILALHRERLAAGVASPTHAEEARQIHQQIAKRASEKEPAAAGTIARILRNASTKAIS